MNPNMDMAEQAQKPQETNTQAYRIHRKLPSDNIKFIWQTSLETYCVSGTVLGARNSGVTMSGHCSNWTYILVGETNRFVIEYWILKAYNKAL